MNLYRVNDSLMYTAYILNSKQCGVVVRIPGHKPHELELSYMIDNYSVSRRELNSIGQPIRDT